MYKKIELYVNKILLEVSDHYNFNFLLEKLLCFVRCNVNFLFKKLLGFARCSANFLSKKYFIQQHYLFQISTDQVHFFSWDMFL